MHAFWVTYMSLFMGILNFNGEYRKEQTLWKMNAGFQPVFSWETAPLCQACAQLILPRHQKGLLICLKNSCFNFLEIVGYGDQRHAVYCDGVCQEWRDVW